jgi:plasmid stabilization system protein ParE
VARVELSEEAVQDLDRLIVTHSLPSDTKQRLQRSLRPLERFPRMGAEVGERRPSYRFLIGPWPWLLVLYGYIESEDRVVVISIEDGRSASATAVRTTT